MSRKYVTTKLEDSMTEDDRHESRVTRRAVAVAGALVNDGFVVLNFNEPEWVENFRFLIEVIALQLEDFVD